MKVQESFEISESPERLWEFFSQPERVAECVPGVESVEVIDDDNLRVQLTQSVGPMNATFSLRMSVTERVEGEAIAFTAVGRVVRGAAGSVRSTNRVGIAPGAGEQTRVEVDADVAMGGMLGSVGQKVIAKQAESVTAGFAERLQRALRGEPLEPEAVAEAGAPAVAGETATGPGAVPTVPLDWRAASVGALLLLLVAWLAGRNAGSNAAYARMVKEGLVK